MEDSLRNRYKIIIILLCLIALTGLMYIDSIEHMENYDPTVAYQVGDEIIDTYVVGDKLHIPRNLRNRSNGTERCSALI